MEPSPHKNKATVKHRGPRASTKSASSKRRTMSTTARKRPLRKCRNTSKCDAVVDSVPGKFEIFVETVPESQLSARPTSVKNTPSRQTMVCGARQKTEPLGKLKKIKVKRPAIGQSDDAYCLENDCCHNRKENAEMLQCSHCGMWHHFDCVRLKTRDTIGVWPCPRCRQQTAMVTSCHTMLNDISKKDGSTKPLTRRGDQTIS